MTLQLLEESHARSAELRAHKIDGVAINKEAEASAKN